MTFGSEQLISAARAVVDARGLSGGGSAGSVGAAILTEAGSVYTGVCIELSCGLGLCAEVSAIAQMVTFGETHIGHVVAVTADRILPPCGRCRETLMQLDERNAEAKVIVSDVDVVTLRSLLPAYWRENLR